MKLPLAYSFFTSTPGKEHRKHNVSPFLFSLLNINLFTTFNSKLRNPFLWEISRTKSLYLYFNAGKQALMKKLYSMLDGDTFYCEK